MRNNIFFSRDNNESDREDDPHIHTTPEKKEGKNVNTESKRNFPKNPLSGISADMSPRQQFFMNMLTAVVFLLILTTFYVHLSQKKENEPIEVGLTEIVEDIKKGAIQKITVEGDIITAELADGTKKETKKEYEDSFSQTLLNYGVTPKELRSFEFNLKKESGFAFWLITLAPIIVPLIFIILIIWMISRQVKGAGMQAFTFGQSKARVIDPNDKNQRVTFKDVAGVKEAKEELLEIVDFLRNPKKFLEIGARIPKGVVLMGAPGTGKTLLARAVAGEARVPYFHLSGSEFVEMFVGVGASRVRDLFKMAKKAAPAIIFVDEIDAVGRIRGTGVGGGNDEREQTLNQILVEMDGFEPNEKVIVMAATNRPDVLDPALLRPGRFDRRITLDLPDINDREQILKIHMRKKPMHEDVDIRVIAQRTPGFSGADLYSLMNEGAILAARENRKSLTQYDLIRSIEKVMLGPERKSHILSKDEKKITAYHEVGHALVASVLPYADPVHKVSIISRGHAAGYTLTLPSEDKRMQSRKEFYDDMAVKMGGYVAEMLIFDDLTTGPSNDLAVATALARNMVVRWGMSEKIGPVALDDASDKMRYGRGFGDKEYSEKMSADVDAEVKRILEEAKARAHEVLMTHKEALDGLAKELIRLETIERAEFDTLLLGFGIHPKKQEEYVA